jgi:hypothetical protein
MSETRILIRLLQMYFPRNWEFGSALSKLRNFGGFEPPQTPFGTPLVVTLHVFRSFEHNYTMLLVLLGSGTVFLCRTFYALVDI